MMSIEQNNLNQALTCYNQGEFLWQRWNLTYLL